MAQFKISHSRLIQIWDRQGKDRWGSDYLAGIFADPKECPGISHGAILRPNKLGRREFHCLSPSETFCALLALYNPNCFELFDQRALSPVPRPHILFGHPLASGLNLGSYKGTLDVAERLGMLSHHPKVRLQTGPDPALWPLVPFPYFADQTLCLLDNAGPFCLRLDG